MVIEHRSVGGGSGLDDARFLLYLPRMVATWPSGSNVQEVEATLVFADVAGFTALTERLSAAGSIGSEQVTEQVNAIFTEILSVARLEGGDLLSFGGDAVLLMFSGEDHRRRALSAAMEMQEAISEDMALGASIGVATGRVRVVLAGSRQRMILTMGPVVDAVVSVEAAADAGEVVAAPATLEGVETECRGPARGHGFLVAVAPEPSLVEVFDDVPGSPTELSRFVPPSLHSELAVTGADGEHRPAVVGFVRVRGTTTTWDGSSTAEALDGIVDALVDEADHHRVGVLAADIDADGVKIIVTAGVPQAVPEPHERLIRTMRRFVDRLGDHDIRIGVADGNVFAGDLGAAFRRSYTVMGDPVNTAARLASLAGPGEILVSPPVAEIVAVGFATEARSEVSLKGKAAPVTPVAIGAPLTSAATSQPKRGFVGRRGELEHLVAAMAEARSGHQRVVEILGPGGIGKTRLVAEFVGALDGVAHLSVSAQEYERSNAYRLVGSLLRKSVDIPLEATAEEAGIRLTDVVESVAPELKSWLPLLAVAGEALVPMTPEVHDLDARFVASTTARVLVELASALIDGPLVVSVDNREWVDPASRELLELMIDLTTDRPWLWLLAGRGDAMWSDAESLVLGPLAEEDVRRLMAEVALEVPPHVIDTLAARSDGNPLFAVELAALGDAESVPDTIERLIATRIDRLGGRERRLLRYASVLGTEFDLDLFAEALAPIAGGLDDAGTWGAVEEFLSVSTLGKVRFAQSLVRDVAYAGLSYRRRGEIHSLVAATIERRARHRARRFASALSMHYEAAGDHAKTWEYGVIAGRRAAATWAHREAVTHFRRALTAAEELEGVDGPDIVAAALEMAEAADVAATWDDAEFALDVGERHARPDDRLPLAVARARLAEKRGELELSADLVEAAGPTVTSREGLDAALMLAGVRYRQGRFEDCEKLAESVVDAPAVAEHADVRAHALRLLSLAQTHLRRPDRRRHAEQAIEMFESIGKWSEVGKSYNNLAIDSYYGGDWEEAARLYAAGREASERAGDVVTVATFDNNLAEIRSDQGHWDEARLLFDRARVTWTTSSYAVGSALVLSNLGRLDVRTGEFERGYDRLERALAEFEKIGASALAYETEIRLAEALVAMEATDRALPLIDELDDRADDRDGTLERLRGHALAMEGDTDGAVEAFGRAIPLLESVEVRFDLGLALRALERLNGEITGRGHDILRDLGAEGAHLLPLQRLDP